MESRWYVPAGKILEKTRIEDRKHALHIARENWSKITLHLDRKKIIAEAIESEENYKKAMKAASDAMTKNWDNSVENIHKRQEEQRIARSDVKAGKNMERYLELKKIQAEERKNYIEQMHEKMRMKKDYPKSLHSALTICEVIYENERQLELNDKIKQHHIQEALKYDQQVADGALAEAKEKAEAERKRKEKNDKYAKDLKDQIKEVEMEKERERKESIESEILDYARSVKEMQQIEESNKKKALENRAKAKREKEEFLEEQRKYKQKLIEEEKQIDVIVDIIAQSNKKIECIKKFRAAQAKEERMKKAERMGLAVEAETKEKLRLEEEHLLKRQLEAEKQYQEKMKNAQAKRDLIKRDLLEGKMNAERKREEQRIIDEEVAKWEMLNRFKTAEEDLKYREGKYSEKRQELMAQKKDWDEQIAENEKAKVDEKEMERKEVECEKELNKLEDARFLEYANQLVKTTKERGRMTYPMEKVIANYKKNVMGEKPPRKPCKPNFCQRNCHRDIVNTTPGKLSHNPNSDPNYAKKMCKCKCHKDILYQ